MNKKSGELSIEHALGITSQTPEQANAQRVLSTNRGHWVIENSCHYIIDWSFHEDRSRICVGHGPANVTRLRRFAIVIFARVDANVWSMLWRWAVRRHPEKGAQWVRKKYFQTRGARNWVFAATEKEEDGTSRESILLKESDTSIKRHIKIKAAANPHDPQWEQYFESRWGKKMLNSARGHRILYRVWRRQDGMCSSCQKPITRRSSWEVSHIVKRSEGGSDAASNLHMHHLNCRRSQQYAVNEVV